ncbi:hypothetical protein [Pilimelia columellifera]|uniref:Uncharacterized protein n=1 Tax=Pilimelia columellifera subsp. columellifera TaxID=706583 RepID=A0ABP6AZT9_9ACTN
MGARGSGLTADDLGSIRDSLAAGRRPRVMFTDAAGQVAGQVGQVVSVADDDAEVVVRFGRDELPFGLSDVMIAPRGAGRPKAQPPVAVVEEPLPGPGLLPPVVEAPVAVVAPQQRAQEESGRVRRVPKAGRAKGPAGLTITVGYAEGEWSVSAQQGSRVLAKPCVIRPAEALRLVGLLEVPAVQEAVEQIVVVERDRARERAEQLRAELAEVEARLAELPGS